MIRGLAALALGALALAPACVSKDPPEVTRTIESSAEIQSPWLGHSRQEMETAWGRPSATEPDGQGGSILVYNRPTKARFVPTDDPTTPQDDVPLIEDESLAWQATARFWVGPDDKIYRAWIEPKLWKKGYPLPGDRAEDRAKEP